MDELLDRDRALVLRRFRKPARKRVRDLKLALGFEPIDRRGGELLRERPDQVMRSNSRAETALAIDDAVALVQDHDAVLFNQQRAGQALVGGGREVAVDP